MFHRKIGIDLGTANTLVFIPQKGIVLNEPTVVAISVDDNKILAVGAEAREMIGRTPENIVAHRPLKDGVIADYRITQAMIQYFIGKSLGRFRIFKPEVMISVPAGITSTERRAVIDATMKAGAKAAYIVKQPVLAAIGAGIPINEPSGNMVIDIGGGTAQVAVISLGGIVAWASIRIGGNKLDQAIADYIKKVHNLAIGDRTAEDIKIKIGNAILQKQPEKMEINGRDLMLGLPRALEISANEVNEAVKDHLIEIVRTVKKVLSETPPEIAADIINKGMVLTGGTSLLKNLDELFYRETGVPAYVSNDAMFCVAKGTGIALGHLDVYKKSIMSKK